MKVPTYGAPHVAPAGLPDARISPAAPDAAFGVPSHLQVGPAAELARKLYQQEQDRQAQTQALDLDNQLAAAQRDILANPDSGVLNKHGVDALGADTAARDAWQSRVGAIAKNIRDQRVGDAFQRMVASRGQDLADQVERHVANERDAHTQQVFQTGAQSNVNDAVAHLDDPAALALAVAKQKALTADYWRTQRGESPDVVQARQAEAVSALHAAVLDAMLGAGKDQQAAAYFGAHQDELQGADRVNAQNAVAKGTLLGSAQRTADTIIATTNGDPTKADEAVRAIADPELRKATQSEVDEQLARRDRDQRIQQEQLLQQASALVEAGKPVPYNLRSKLLPSQNASLTERERQLARGDVPTADLGLVRDYRQMAANPATRQAFAQADLLTDLPRLGTAQYNALRELQTQIRSGNTREAESIGTNEQAFNRAIGQAGWDPAAKYGTDEGKRNTEVWADVQQAVAQLGKKATPEDVYNITSDFLVQAVLKGGEDRKYIFELAPTEQVVLSADDIPAPRKRQLSAQFRQQLGRDPTNKELVDAYARVLGYETGRLP